MYRERKIDRNYYIEQVSPSGEAKVFKSGDGIIAYFKGEETPATLYHTDEGWFLLQNSHNGSRPDRGMPSGCQFKNSWAFTPSSRGSDTLPDGIEILSFESHFSLEDTPKPKYDDTKKFHISSHGIQFNINKNFLDVITYKYTVHPEIRNSIILYQIKEYSEVNLIDSFSKEDLNEIKEELLKLFTASNITCTLNIRKNSKTVSILKKIGFKQLCSYESDSSVYIILILNKIDVNV